MSRDSAHRAVSSSSFLFFSRLLDISRCHEAMCWHNRFLFAAPAGWGLQKHAMLPVLGLLLNKSLFGPLFFFFFFLSARAARIRRKTCVRMKCVPTHVRLTKQQSKSV